jgi:hypothetical protein
MTVTLRSLRTLRTLRSLRSLRYLRYLRTLRSQRTLRTVRLPAMRVVTTACLVVAGGACSAEVARVEAAEAAPADSAMLDTSPDRYTPSLATRKATAKRVPWPVGFAGAGPLRPEMSLAKAVIAMEGDFYTLDRSIRCAYFRAARAPGMRFLFLNRFLARIEVDSGSAATSEGIRIGSTEAEVEAAYPGRVSVTADPRLGVRFLTVAPAQTADSALGMVFETDGQRVTRFRSGLRFTVRWLDGCS